MSEGRLREDKGTCVKGGTPASLVLTCSLGNYSPDAQPVQVSDEAGGGHSAGDK